MDVDTAIGAVKTYQTLPAVRMDVARVLVAEIDRLRAENAALRTANAALGQVVAWSAIPAD